MPTRSTIKNILKDQHLAPKKRFGQNFLVNEQIVETILDRAAPDKEDTIIEFGVGLGSLTIPLAKRVKQVIGIEIDSGIVQWHTEQATLPDNVSLIHEDLLKTDLARLAADCGGRLKIIANLPYSISNPVLFKMIENKDHIASAVIMLQKEVADRLCAQPRTKAYGVLSVLLGTCATIEPLLKIGPDHFHPRPKVDSMVIRITFQAQPFPPGTEGTWSPTLLKALVKVAFQQRRKTIVNALSSGAVRTNDKKIISQYLNRAGIAPTRRPDQLSVQEYIALSQAYDKGEADA
ncbi:MAG: ribosomal RNA small subunit methyltransferase A [Proteobacteria bacterium]|nr:ribosomal RNA small subunit methyltransferase A [Desulfobulbaceae bacterium]MBU4152381.1 ribosomal RNA small subunit methyltransferase A [Pseudomonadota bacterium]